MKNLKMVIIVRKDLNMRKGKIAAQAAHAAQEALLDRYTDPAEPRLKLSHDILDWLMGDYRKAVVGVESLEELMDMYQAALVHGMINHHLVQDLGHTEFHGVKTYTTLAIGPADAELVDRITGHLKLL